jgi:CubicO group peptidase (beta-lactamase class C family)
MTKPMTTVGALMLYEQGRILIDDPLAKYLPRFANMRVAVRDASEPTAETVPANRQITIQDLMRHTSGQFSWPGASGTDWWVDPREELAVVYLSAAPGPIRWHYRQLINALVHQAIVE